MNQRARRTDLALADQTFFYDSMEIPIPANEFLLWSWGGNNTAMLTVLVIATVSRLRVLMVTALVMLLVGQAGDVNAGAQSGTNVFITWIAFGLVVLQSIAIWFDTAGRTERPAKDRALTDQAA